MSDKKLICRCEEISENEIAKAIADGATTVDGVKRRTRAGMGLCQGRTCGGQVAALIVHRTGKDPAEVVPHTARAPVRTMSLAVIKERDKRDNNC